MHVMGQTACHIQGKTKNGVLIRGDKNYSIINAGMSRAGNGREKPLCDTFWLSAITGYLLCP